MLLLFSLPILLLAQESIVLRNSTNSFYLIDKGIPNPEFTATTSLLGCSMPHLFIYNDTTQSEYSIQSKNVTINSIEGKYMPIQFNKTCSKNNCNVTLENGCTGSGKNQMNMIVLNVGQNFQLQYLVNCAPDLFYKPFEWGLFILVCFCTIAITLSSLYSRAWSYDGFGITINAYFIIVFNALVILGSILAYFIPQVTSIALKVVGSAIGIIGVNICMAETLWLLKSQKLKTVLFWKVRVLDVISFLVGVVCLIGYWVSGGIWLLNDILAVCTIVAGIKILKIRSLKIGIILLFSLLLIEIIAGLLVHYVLRVSYNNLVINLFQSPLVIVFPSITHEFFRKCAWLPVTNLIFPGIFISYLRRFDKARGTFLYLFIGYVSFYVGSVAWIFIDMLTVHALPFALLSEPIMILVVCILGNRRNQLKTMMDGIFYDPEMPDMSEELLGQRSTRALQEITRDLRIERQSSSQNEQI